jgi:hypothetical protein
VSKPQSSARSPQLSRVLLIGLVLLFAAPLLLAVLFYRFSDWLPVPAPNSHGTLITPAHPFKRFDLVALSGKLLDIGYLRDQWTLVYVGGAECDLWCQAAQFKMRQVRLALGEDQGRVQRLYLLKKVSAPRSLRWLLRRYPGMTVATPNEEARSDVLSAFGEPRSGAFFLIDPRANLMMRYPPSATSEGLKQDLTRLLEASQIG